MKLPGMRKVKSSTIKTIGFRHVKGQSSELFIRFKSGQLYRYFNVPRPVYEIIWDASELKRSFLKQGKEPGSLASPGTMLHLLVKVPGFQYEIVQES
jgi:hypothetical protein